MEEAARVLKETTVQQLVAGKGRLVEVPYSASVGDTLHTMLAHNIVAVAVAAPPNHWIGAGNSMILETDRITGTARKQYIGIVSALDVLIHLAELKHEADAASLLAGTRVSTIIGHCLEGLSLWAISPHTSIMDAMDPMCKGLHRALVPLESQMERHISGLESEELSPSYRMLTQTDFVRFLYSKSENLHPIVSRSVEDMGVIQPHVFGVPADMTLLDTMKCMTRATVTAIAILDLLAGTDEEDMQDEPGQQLVPARGKRIVGTFSASDLRGCSVESFQQWARDGVLQFLARAHAARKFGVGGTVLGSADAVSQTDIDAHQVPPLTCYPSSTLQHVISKALEWRVHRVWVIDQQEGLLVGAISFSDILRIVRQCVESSS